MIGTYRVCISGVVSGFTVCSEEDKLALLEVDRDALCS